MNFHNKECENFDHVKGNTDQGFRFIDLPSEAQAILAKVKELNPDGRYIFMNKGKQLNSTREILARHYIQNTDMTTNDIAYLLGYAEHNSFLRAFIAWTGKSITEYRKEIEEDGEEAGIK